MRHPTRSRLGIQRHMAPCGICSKLQFLKHRSSLSQVRSSIFIQRLHRTFHDSKWFVCLLHPCKHRTLCHHAHRCVLPFRWCPSILIFTATRTMGTSSCFIHDCIFSEVLYILIKCDAALLYVRNGHGQY